MVNNNGLVKLCDFDPTGTSSVTEPNNLTASVNDNIVSLSWDESVSGAKYTLINRSLDNPWGTPMIASNLTSNSYVDTIDVSQTYEYLVYAEKDGYLSKTVRLNNVNKVFSPTNLSAENTSNGVRLHWNHSITPNIKYAVFKRDNNNWYNLSLTGALATEITNDFYIDSSVNLVAQTYHYEVLAYIGNHLSNFYPEVTIDVPAYTPTLTAELEDYAAQNISSGYILKWTYPLIDNLSFNIYRREVGTVDDHQPWAQNVTNSNIDANGYQYFYAENLFNLTDYEALDKDYIYYIKPVVNGQERAASNEINTNDLRLTMSISLPSSLSSTPISYLGKKVDYEVTVKKADNSSLSKARIIVNDGQGNYTEAKNQTDIDGKTTYSTFMTRTGTPGTFVQNFTAKRWPYLPVTYNTAIPADYSMEIWDNGFRPETNGFRFANFGTDGNCFGFSLGSLLKYWNPSFATAVSNPYDLYDCNLDVKNSVNTAYIENCQAREFGSTYYYAESTEKNKGLHNSVAELIESFKSDNKGDLRFIIYELSNPYLRHAVVPYEIVRKYNPNNLANLIADTIYVYDCNLFFSNETDPTSHVKKVVVTYYDNEWIVTGIRDDGEEIIKYGQDRSFCLWSTWPIKDLVGTPSSQKISTSNNSFELNKNIVLSPNPASNELQITLQSASKQRAKISLCDILGSTIKYLSDNEQINIGEYSKTFDISDIQSGYYLLRVILEDKELSQSVIIVK